MQKENNIEKKSKLMLEGNLFKTLLFISIPAAATNLITEIFNLFDIYFSSQIGKTQMAASVLVGPLVNFATSIGIGLGVATITLVAKELANKDYKNAKRILGQILSISFIISIVVLFICLIWSKDILKLVGAEGELLNFSDTYFKIVILTVPFSFFNNIYFGQQRAIGNNRKILILSFSSIVLKLIVSYIFIFVCDYGIAGLGYSSMIATVYTSLFGIYDIFIKKTNIKIGIKNFILSKSVLAVILIVSIPIIIEKSTQSFGNVIVNGYATGLGEQVLNAYGVTNRINSIIFSFSTGFGVAMVSIVSQNKAVGNYDRIKEAKKKGMILSLGIVGVLLVIVFALSGVIARIYSVDDDVLYGLILTAMSIYTISAIPWTVMQIYFGIFQGYQKSIYTLIVSACRLWIFRVFLVGLLIRFTNMGAYAIWYGMLISNIAAMIASILLYHLRIKNKFMQK